MALAWYATVGGQEIEQGDVLFDLPTPRVVKLDPVEGPKVAVSRGNYVVLSQTCDLVNDKVSEILVANVHSYRKMVAASNCADRAKSSSFHKSLVQGADVAYFLLPEHVEEPSLDWALVDFHHLRLVDKSLCKEHAALMGERLRMISPYKEHLAQAFGRYMMRVALPETLHPFEKVGPNIVREEKDKNQAR
ncbi:hypothetical protein [Actinoplanes sp. GCM10030250]|uniref:hypothetical protein n=1 Tax=Actinoplanes sp. GCM10030250 TaxID=3273376 RepID=UPI0036223E20